MGIQKFIKDPLLLVPALASREFFNFLPDEPYLKLRYYSQMRKKLDLETPKTFNEKLQWLKLHDRNPLYTELVDKYEVRKHIEAAIGGEYLIPLLGGPWNSFDEIDFDSLPEQFVLKCTHDSGGLVICRDKANLDKASARVKIEKCLKRNYYWPVREQPYKNVPPRIIAEAYMEDSGREFLTDYKLFCFHGEPKMVLTIQGGHLDESQAVRRMYDENWNLIPVGIRGKAPVTEAEPKPEQLERMLALARKLSAGKKHLRVDFYVVGGHIYFGELTFYHMSGLEQFVPESYDALFGSYLNIAGK